MGDGTEPDALHQAIGEGLDEYSKKQLDHMSNMYRDYHQTTISPSARDLFAAHAMQAIMMRMSPRQFGAETLQDFARDAFKIADMMMEARHGKG